MTVTLHIEQNTKYHERQSLEKRTMRLTQNSISLRKRKINATRFAGTSNRGGLRYMMYRDLKQVIEPTNLKRIFGSSVAG